MATNKRITQQLKVRKLLIAAYLASVLSLACRSGDSAATKLEAIERNLNAFSSSKLSRTDFGFGDGTIQRNFRVASCTITFSGRSVSGTYSGQDHLTEILAMAMEAAATNEFKFSARDLTAVQKATIENGEAILWFSVKHQPAETWRGGVSQLARSIGPLEQELSRELEASLGEWHQLCTRDTAQPPEAGKADYVP